MDQSPLFTIPRTTDDRFYRTLLTRRIDGQDSLIRRSHMARQATAMDTILSITEPQSRNDERAHVLYLRIGFTSRGLAS
jgi:hypothetical protein